jgi:hypothetical protein
MKLEKEGIKMEEEYEEIWKEIREKTRDEITENLRGIEEEIKEYKKIWRRINEEVRQEEILGILRSLVDRKRV